MTESESVALPLGDAAFIHNAYYSRYSLLCQYLFLKNQLFFRFFVSFVPTGASLYIHTHARARDTTRYRACAICQTGVRVPKKCVFSLCYMDFSVFSAISVSCVASLLYHKILMKITNKNTIYCVILLIDKNFKVWYTIRASTKSEVF